MADVRLKEETLERLKGQLVGKIMYRKRKKKIEKGCSDLIGVCLGEIRSISSNGLVYVYNKEYREHNKFSLLELKENLGVNYVISNRYI